MEFFIDAYREEVATKRSMTLGSINESLYRTYRGNAELFHDQLKSRIRRGF